VTPRMLGNSLVFASRTQGKFLRSLDFSLAYHIVPEKVSALRAGAVHMSKHFRCSGILQHFPVFVKNLLKKHKILSKFSEKRENFKLQQYQKSGF
jgi:hypothetical protein